MKATRNDDGTLTVPGRAEGSEGMIGDGMITIGPGHPEYQEWDEWLKLQEGGS